MTEPTILVYYSCPDCGLKKVACSVKAREEEDVIQWMEGVMMGALKRDHERRSPTCRPKALVDIMIPMQGASKVGGPTVQ